MDSVSAALEVSLLAATHLTPMDDGAVEAMRALARKIDTEAELREMALEYAEAHEQKPPSVDNVSIPTFLKYADALGLSPAGRAKIKPAKESEGGKLAQLRAAG